MSLVLDISNKSTITIRISSVGHNLGAAIRKGNSVTSGGRLGVRGLMLVEVGSRVVISDTIFKSVWLWGLIIVSWSWLVSWGWVVWGWSWVVWSRGSSWGSGGSGGQSSEDGS